jgi:hypothetical protein
VDKTERKDGAANIAEVLRIDLEKLRMISAAKRMIWTLTPPRLLPLLTFLKLSTFGLSYILPTRLIVIPNDGGFFSNFNKVVQYLALSLNHAGITAIIVDWRIDEARKLSQFPYGCPEDGNIWEHFFEQFSFPTDSYVRSTKIAQWMDHSITDRAAYALYKSGSFWRQQYHAAFVEYIRIQSHIFEKVDRVYSQYMAGHYCIGVHIRNEAHKVEEPGNTITPLQSYIVKIDEILRLRNGKALVFLATDVETYVTRMKEAFGEKVIMQPGVTRLLEKPSGDFDHQVHHGNAPASLKLGEDVLIDCLLLTKCNVFVHTVSNLATAVGYINPYIEMAYCD